ncbi:MAG: preprotein translocase subunit SecG [Candidatus Pacebacteria bacterium]|jgi:protein translocase SecG subunit|nr:preprotein translocase subunit SecG [Candidatus Paceibacterota bacterium]
MNKSFLITQAIISVILIILVLLQSNAGGSGSLFGASGGETYHTRKGVEKLFFYATIVFGVLFIVNSLLLLIY